MNNIFQKIKNFLYENKITFLKELMIIFLGLFFVHLSFEIILFFNSYGYGVWSLFCIMAMGAFIIASNFVNAVFEAFRKRIDEE